MIGGAFAGTEGGDADDGCDDEVDGDDVDGALRNTGELAQQPAAVGEDHWLGHAEATDPARARLQPRRLDDRWADDAHRHVASRVDQRLLAERLGECIGIGPADARRARPAGIDESVANPALAQLLGLGGQRRGAGGAELAAGLGAQAGELLWLPTGGLVVAAEPASSGDLGAPVEPEVERSRRNELLRCAAAAVAGHVTGRHGDEVRGDPELGEQSGDAGRPEQVDLDGRVERRVERHRRRRMDDRVARPEHLAIGVGQGEAIAADVAADRRDPSRRQLGEAIATVLLAEPVEGVVLEQLALDALCRRRPLAVAHEQHQLTVGHGAEQALDQRRPDESGRPGDGDARSRERLSDHGLQVLARFSTKW